MGHEGKYVVGDGHAFTRALRLEDGQACLVGRRQQFRIEAPLEAGEQALVEALQLHGGLVGRENQLLAALVQVVEDVEEGALRAFLLGEILHVIDDQHVDELVEAQEIGHLIAVVRALGRTGGVHVLVLEGVRTDIEHHFLGEARLDSDADGLGQVGLAESGTAVDEQRVEGAATGIGGDALPCRTAEPVARTFDEILEVVDRIEAGIDVELAQSGDDIGTARVVVAHLGDGNLGVAGFAALRPLFHIDIIEDADLVNERGARSDLPAEHFAQDADEMFFYILAPKVGRDLDRQPLRIERDRLDRAKPGLERLFIQVIPENLQTAVPNFYDGVVGSHQFRLLSNNKIGEKMGIKKTFFYCFFSKNRKMLTIKKKKFYVFVHT